jgi:hypothetical protein
MGRAIVIGDVHGCARELEKLFDRLALGRGDLVFMVGDLVMRGPKPNRVLRLVREVGALSVRGNHEWRLLQWRELKRRRKTRSSERDLSAIDARLLASKMLRRTAAEIDDDGWDYIERMPSWIDVPEQKLCIVHAGLLPGVALAKQPERVLMYVRNLSKDGEPLERRGEGEPWAKRYRGPPHVVYGHNALPKVQLYPWASGIDTGCVYGGKLTALCLPDGRTVPRNLEARRELLVSVKAREIYQVVQ